MLALIISIALFYIKLNIPSFQGTHHDRNPSLHNFSWYNYQVAHRKAYFLSHIYHNQADIFESHRSLDGWIVIAYWACTTMMMFLCIHLRTSILFCDRLCRLWGCNGEYRSFYVCREEVFICTLGLCMFCLFHHSTFICFLLLSLFLSNHGRPLCHSLCLNFSRASKSIYFAFILLISLFLYFFYGSTA